MSADDEVLGRRHFLSVGAAAAMQAACGPGDARGASSADALNSPTAVHDTVQGALGQELGAALRGSADPSGLGPEFGRHHSHLEWAGDLATSSDRAQWVSSISGKRGDGGTVPVRSGTTLLLVQGGSDLSPTIETLWSVQPVDATKAPFQATLSGTDFDGVVDHVLHLGYNALAQAGARGGLQSEPSATYAIEQDWLYESTHFMEMYFQFANPGAGSVYRPFFAQYNRSSGDACITQVNFFSGAAGTGTYSLTDGTTIIYQSVTANGQHSIYSRNADPVGGYSLDLQASSSCRIAARDGTVLIEATGQLHLTGNDASTAGFFDVGISGDVTMSTNEAPGTNAYVLATGADGVAAIQGGLQTNVQAPTVAILGNTYKLYDNSATQWGSVTPAATFAWDYASSVNAVSTRIGGVEYMSLSATALVVEATYLDLHAAPTTTTAPSAGNASPLPATPKGYVSIMVAGAIQQLAYY